MVDPRFLKGIDRLADFSINRLDKSPGAEV
jgi:hypothetical protein